MNKKLNKIRVKLDKIDDSLLILIKKRTSLVKKVLKLKKFKYSMPFVSNIYIITRRQFISPFRGVDRGYSVPPANRWSLPV